MIRIDLNKRVVLILRKPHSILIKPAFSSFLKNRLDEEVDRILKSCLCCSIVSAKMCKAFIYKISCLGFALTSVAVFMSV